MQDQDTNKKTETTTTAVTQGTPMAETFEKSRVNRGNRNISQDASSRRDVSSSRDTINISVANNFIALDVSNVIFLIVLSDHRRKPSASPHCQKLLSA
jgi:hypothetical protein